MRERVWRKASASNNYGSCVEISLSVDVALVRDSKCVTGPQLRFTTNTWRILQDTITGGRNCA